MSSAAGSGLPLEQRAGAIQVPDSIDVAPPEVVQFSEDRSGWNLILQVAAGLAESGMRSSWAAASKQLDPLLQHPVPGIAFGITMQTQLDLAGRSTTRNNTAVEFFTKEVGGQGLFGRLGRRAWRPGYPSPASHRGSDVCIVAGR